MERKLRIAKVGEDFLGRISDKARDRCSTDRAPGIFEEPCCYAEVVEVAMFAWLGLGGVRDGIAANHTGGRSIVCCRYVVNRDKALSLSLFSISLISSSTHRTAGYPLLEQGREDSLPRDKQEVM
jgi:hypothetical protein